MLVDSQVSRQHARLECTQSECFLVDLGSSNGTYLNSEKLQPNSPVLLKDGDKIKIGPFQLAYSQEAIMAIPEEGSPIRIEDFPSPPKEDEKPKKKSESEKTPAGGKIPPPPVETPPASSIMQPDFFYLRKTCIAENCSSICQAFTTPILCPVSWVYSSQSCFRSSGRWTISIYFSPLQQPPPIFCPGWKTGLPFRQLHNGVSNRKGRFYVRRIKFMLAAALAGRFLACWKFIVAVKPKSPIQERNSNHSHSLLSFHSARDRLIWKPFQL